MRIKIPGLYIVLCVVLAGLIHIVDVLSPPAAQKTRKRDLQLSAQPTR